MQCKNEIFGVNLGEYPYPAVDIDLMEEKSFHVNIYKSLFKYIPNSTLILWEFIL